MVVAFGILLVLLGSLSMWVVKGHIFMWGQSFDMDLVGLIFFLVGAMSVVLGLIVQSMAPNSSKIEEHNVFVEKDLPVAKKPTTRKKKST